MKPLVRWTIGPVKPAGYEALRISITKFVSLYDVEIAICYNGHPPIHRDDILLVKQESEKAKGVAWKLYPPRLDISRHELFIDNDLILHERIDQIDDFFASDSTLLLEGLFRNYGRLDKDVPQGYRINSGLFGIPPGFDLKVWLDFYGENWEANANPASFTFDEQGLIAASLLRYKRFNVIPNDVITDCGTHFLESKGMHFVGLNRQERHKPWNDYLARKVC